MRYPHICFFILLLCLGAGSWALGSPSVPFQPTRLNDDWLKVVKNFQQALASGNPQALEKAASAVVADNSKRAVELVLKALKVAGANAYWSLIGALGKCTTEEGLGAIGEEILTGKVPELRRDLIMSLRLCESKAVGPILRRILKEGIPELQVSAMDEVVDKLDLESVPVLLDIAEKDPKAEKEITRRVFRTLRCIAGSPPEGSPLEWRGWWAAMTNASNKTGVVITTKPGVVGTTVVETLRPLRATQFNDLKRVDKEDFLVMSGEYDSVEEILALLEIPHTVASFSGVKSSDERTLAKYSAVFLNCAAIGDWPARSVQLVKEYVAQGGYLFVSDLGVLHLVRHAFPGYMEFKAGNLSAQIVTVTPSRGSTGHSLMRGVEVGINSSSRQTWQIDEGGPAFQFDHKSVISLIEAPDLAQKKKPAAVAVTFLYSHEGKGPPNSGFPQGGMHREIEAGGRVLCVLSHFKKQRKGEDGFALQNLLINFLIEARDRKLMREDAGGRKK